MFRANQRADRLPNNCAQFLTAQIISNGTQKFPLGHAAATDFAAVIQESSECDSSPREP